MKKTGMILGVLISGLISAAHADVRDIGNGGNVLVCYGPKKKIQSIELYDYYEARTKRGIQIDLGSASLSMDEKIRLGLSRLRRLNPNRERLYLIWYERFFKEAAIIDNVELVPVPDVGVGVIPKNCEVKQVAGQQAPVFPGDSRYVINGDLWKKMDSNTKAGLILHELTLREATMEPNNHTTSTATRYFHSQFASHALDNLTLRQYADLIALVNFHFMDAGGFIIPMLDGLPFFYDDHTLKEGRGNLSRVSYWSEVPLTYEFQGQTLNVFEGSAKFYSNGQIERIEKVSSPSGSIQFHSDYVEGEVLSGGGMAFYQDGNISGLRGTKGYGGLRSKDFDIKFYYLNLFKNGRVAEAGVEDGVYRRGNQTAKLGHIQMNPDSFACYEDGRPKTISLLSPMILPITPTIELSVIGMIKFSENGFVEFAEIYGIQKVSFSEQDIVLQSYIENKGEYFSTKLAQAMSLKNEKGKIVYLSEGMLIRILPNGLLKDPAN